MMSYAGGSVENANLDEIHVRSLLGSKVDFKSYDFHLVEKQPEALPLIANNDTIQIDLLPDRLVRTTMWVAIISAVASVGLGILTYQSSQKK
jgi:hypothetical protein